MRTRITAASATVFLLIGLAACGGSDDPAPKDDGAEEVSVTSVAADDCIDVGDLDAETDDAEFATENVVDCDDDHQFEVYSVTDLPEDLVTDEVLEDDFRERLSGMYSDYLDDADLDDYREFAGEVCDPGYAEASGLDAITIAGESAGEDFFIAPLSHVMSQWTVFPAESWADQPRLVCAVRFSERAPVGEALTDQDLLDVAGRQLENYLSVDFDEDLRSCETLTVEGASENVECDDAHYGEYVYFFDATDLVSDDMTAAIVALGGNAPDEALQDQLDDLCTATLDEVVGDDYSSEVDGRTLVGGGWDGAAEYNFLICEIKAVNSLEFDLPGGSLIGAGDVEVEPVPYGGA